MGTEGNNSADHVSVIRDPRTPEKRAGLTQHEWQLLEHREELINASEWTAKWSFRRHVLLGVGLAVFGATLSAAFGHLTGR